MPPPPPRKKNGQFASRTQAGQPPSSLATPPVPHPSSQQPSSRIAPPSHPVSPSSRTEPPSRPISPSSRATSPSRPASPRIDLSGLIDPHSDVRRALRLGAETERTSAPERPPSRVPLLIFFSPIFLSFLLPHARHNSFKLRHKTSTIYAFQSQSFPPSLPRSFILLLCFLILHLWSRSLEQRLLSTKQLPHGTHTHFLLSLPFKLCAYSFYSFTITGTPEVASTIQDLR